MPLDGRSEESLNLPSDVVIYICLQKINEVWEHLFFTLMSHLGAIFFIYPILPINGATRANKGAPHSLEEAHSTINVQNTHSLLNSCPIFNPKPPLESSEPQLSPHNIRSDLANAPGTLIRKNTVYYSPCQMFAYSYLHAETAIWLGPL